MRKESAQGKEKKVFFCTISKISFEKIFLVVGVNVRENMRRGIWEFSVSFIFRGRSYRTFKTICGEYSLTLLKENWGWAIEFSLFFIKFEFHLLPRNISICEKDKRKWIYNFSSRSIQGQIRSEKKFWFLRKADDELCLLFQYLCSKYLFYWGEVNEK